MSEKVIIDSGGDAGASSYHWRVAFLALAGAFIGLALANIRYRYPPDTPGLLFVLGACLVGMVVGIIAPYVVERKTSRKSSSLEAGHIVMSATGGLVLSALLYVALLWLAGGIDVIKDGMAKNPPWMLLSGIATAPSLLLLWYWRHKNKDKENAVKEQQNKLLKRERNLAEQARLDEQMEASLHDVSGKAKALDIVRLGIAGANHKNWATPIVEHLLEILDTDQFRQMHNAQSLRLRKAAELALLQITTAHPGEIAVRTSSLKFAKTRFQQLVRGANDGAENAKKLSDMLDTSGSESFDAKTCSRLAQKVVNDTKSLARLIETACDDTSQAVETPLPDDGTPT